jgi:Fe-S-cluster containining protein
VSDDKGTTYSYDVCSACKITCCQDAKPPLSGKRKKIITNYLTKHNLNVEQPFTTKAYCYPSIYSDLLCVFYDPKTKRCIIHPVKPETCIAGPITFGINMQKGTVEFFLKKKEICAYAGELFKDKVALKEHYKEAREKIIALIKELSAEELMAINSIDEPQTFKFCEEPLPAEVAKKLDL